jgi:uncharacterized protein
MRLDDEKPSDNVEDRRGQGGGFGWPGGGGGRQINIPMGGGRGGFSFSTLVMLAIAYFALKLIFGIDLISIFNGGSPGGFQLPGNATEYQLPDRSTDVGAAPQAQPGKTAPTSGDPAKDFIARILGSTERVWSSVFKEHLGQQYQPSPLVLFSGFVQSGCGMAQAAMGPFYCPRDGKVYIDLSFYQDMKNKLGAPGDAAQAYVIAHEVGHHIQNLLGIADKVTQARARSDEVTGNQLQVRMELQADCLAGIWAQEANESKGILEDGDIEEAINAASQIGDDRLQKRSQGYVNEESFTHGSSEQRVRWLRKGMQAQKLSDCDTFTADDI